MARSHTTSILSVIMGGLLVGSPAAQPPLLALSRREASPASRPSCSLDEQVLMAPNAGVLETFTASTLNGKKMPEKPEAGWLPAPKGMTDGDSCEQRAGQPSVVYKGTCWYEFPNPARHADRDPTALCSNAHYDPPSNAKPGHKDSCFLPLKVRAQSILITMSR
jgi:hypothetical protein